MLSCFCAGEINWYFEADDDFSVLDTKNSRKCVSCYVKIKPGDECLRFIRYRDSRGDYELGRFGEFVPLSNYYHCESCGGLFMALDDLGFCFNLDDDMRQLVEEYNEMQEE